MQVCTLSELICGGKYVANQVIFMLPTCMLFLHIGLHFILLPNPELFRL